MGRRIGLGLALLAAFVVGVFSAVGCSTRDLACPGFDGCATPADCPLVRCVCGGIPAVSPPTCRADGTCTTSVDCVEVCGAAHEVCARPPASCDVFIPTECQCASGSTRFAAAWDCATGTTAPTSSKDCDDTCDNPDPPATSTVGVGASGSGTSGSTGSSF
jgi:hypothetical protein